MNNSNGFNVDSKGKATLLEKLCVSLAMLALLILCILVTVSVVSRWLSMSFIPDYVLLVQELMLWVILFPLAVVTAQRSHIAVTFFTERFKDKNIILLNIIAHFIGVVFAGGLLWSAIRLFMSALESKEYYDGDLYLPLWLGYAIFVLGLLLFFGRLFLVLTEDIRSFLKG